VRSAPEVTVSTAPFAVESQSFLPAVQRRLIADLAFGCAPGTNGGLQTWHGSSNPSLSAKQND
jgi:hypothetical protein